MDNARKSIKCSIPTKKKKLSYSVVIFLLHTKTETNTRHPQRGGITQHVIFTVVTPLFRGPWQRWYFLWGLWCMANTLTLFWLNKCVTLRWATDLLRPSASYVNAHPECDGEIRFSAQICSTQRNLSPHARLTLIPISFESCDNVRKKYCIVLKVK